MSLQTSTQSLEKAFLQDRIKSYYDFLNERQWQECFNFIDPKLKDEGKITLDDYIGSLTSFFAKSGTLENIAIGDVKLYLNERGNQYDDRDFAYAESVWTDRQKRSHKIQERWVKAANGHWYSRMVGLV